MKDEAFEKAWRTSPWFGNAHERTVAWSFWQAASLNQAVQAEAHLHEPQTAETCQAVPPHARAYYDNGWRYEGIKGEPLKDTGQCLMCEAVKQGQVVIAALRRDLENPPPDVQKKVIKMLDLVSRDALKEADKQGRDAALDEAWEIAFHADSAPNAAKEIHRLREGGRK